MKNPHEYGRHVDRIIKVCGMKDPDNIRLVSALTPLLMGFIFYDRSPRCAGHLDPAVVKNLPGFIKPVGVFVDAGTDTIVDTCRLYGINVVQLHGEETPGMCRHLKSHGFTVFKGIGITPDVDWNGLKSYDDVVDMFVFDSKCDTKGGGGKKYDWRILEDYPLSTPYLLSGGIGPDDIPAILRALQPKMAGVDINSRFETEPGIKDIEKLIHFVLSLRKYNEE